MTLNSENQYTLEINWPLSEESYLELYVDKINPKQCIEWGRKKASTNVWGLDKKVKPLKEIEQD